MEDMNNQVLYPGWETVRLIGRGSFGAVYEIQRELFGETEKAALKVITIPQSASDIEEMYSEGYNKEDITNTFQNHLKSIISEYTLMRKLNGSSNVVNCDDVRYIQHDDGIGWDIFIKMELLTPLNKVLSENIPEEQVLDVGRDICRALVLCKEHKIIHRDIKPQNIFVSEYGDYKLGDFGIAKTVEKTSGGTKIGTYKYMAPEVYHDEPYGASADIYSLGLVLYWMLNERRMPFLPLPPEKLSASAEENARRRRLSGDPLPAPAHGSKTLKQIVLRACAYAPKDRYRSAAEMLSALESIGTTDGQETICPAPTASAYEDPTEGFGWKAKAPEPEDEKTASIWRKQEKESESGEDKTVSAWAKTEPDKSAPVPAPGEKSSKKKFLWIVAFCLALVLVAGIVGMTAGGKTNAIANETVNRPSVEKTNAIVAISAGYNHTVGLRSDGTVVAVGDNEKGQCDVSDWSNIVSISAGYYHTVGLRSDGTVVAVGNNWNGQCNVSGWRDIVSISADEWQTVGLRSDGTVVAVGNNVLGPCDTADWSDIVSISAGHCYTVGLHSDGTVVAVGDNVKGQCDVSGWHDIVAVGAGYWHTVGLRSDGTVVAVGDNERGQCDVSDWSDIVSISVGALHTVGLRSDGTVVAVGENVSGQCFTFDWSDIVMIDAGSFHSVGLKADGTVVAVGRNGHGQCNVFAW